MPSGATVSRVGTREPLGTTPFTTQVERNGPRQAFVLRLAGHRDVRIELDTRTDTQRTITLARIAPSRAKPRPPAPLPRRLDSFDHPEP